MSDALEVALAWSSRLATHVDRTWFDAVDPAWLPAGLSTALERGRIGEAVRADFAAGQIVPAFDAGLVRTLPETDFRRTRLGDAWIEPRVGRFYPRSLLSGVPEAPPGDQRPFRCIGREGGSIVVDLNHPLCAVPLRAELIRRQPMRPASPLPSRFDPLERAAAGGPGLQAAPERGDTDFHAAAPFARQDEADDRAFYAGARLTDHLDAVALDRLRGIHRRFLRPGMRVLDLMSSVNSHLPEEIAPLEVTGLGMNEAELLRNPRLAERVVHDLNRNRSLPFADGRFDAALCTVSVEYLIRPVEVFREVRRVLRAGAPFVLSFSERWFPPKVIRIWTELHPYERLGLVLDWLHRAGGFAGLGTESLRGLPRPADDKYAGLTRRSDPLYCAWGLAA